MLELRLRTATAQFCLRSVPSPFVPDASVIKIKVGLTSRVVGAGEVKHTLPLFELARDGFYIIRHLGDS
jgi:hypothetical protein